jgi:hypothetical protein
MGTVIIVAVAALLGLGAIFLHQDRLLYFPARAPVEALARGPLRAWPSADDFRGLVAEPPGPPRGTAIVFHGNAGHAGHRDHYADALVPLGWRVLLAEYPGYGPRRGTPGEAALVDDAVETLERAHAAYGAPLVLVGESLGAAVAAQAGVRGAGRVAGLLLITPWDHLAHVGAHHYPWLPVGWMLRDPYDSARHLADFGRPVVVVVAERDRIVPARYGEALHASLRGPRHLVVVPGSDHNDWPGRVDAAWWDDVLARALGERPR